MSKREKAVAMMAQAVGGMTVCYVATNAAVVMYVENPWSFALRDLYDLASLRFAWPTLALELLIGLGMLLALIAVARLLVRRRFLPLAGDVARQWSVGAAKGLVIFVLMEGFDLLMR